MIPMMPSLATATLSNNAHTHFKHTWTPLQAASTSTSSSSSSRDGDDFIFAKRKQRRRLTGKQRERYLENQADDSQLLNLTLDINNLRQEVQTLIEGKRVQETRMHVARQHLEQRVMQTISQFYHLFRHGYNEQWTDEERDMIYNLVDEQVVVTDDVRGIELFLEQWRRYTVLFQSRSLKVFSINFLSSNPDGCIVECVGKYEGLLTRAAISTVFPHITENLPLVATLEGSELVCPTRSLVYFDSSARIVQYNAHVDFLTGLNTILGKNVMDAVIMMSGARIGVGSLIPAEPDKDEAQKTPQGPPAKRHLIKYLLSQETDD